MKERAILVVEDTYHELEAAKVILTEQGFTLTTATNLRHGEKILKQLDENIVGVITDLMIPEFGGKAFAPLGLNIVLDAVNKFLPVVICSSFDQDQIKIWVDEIQVLGDRIEYPFKITHTSGVKDWQKAGELLNKILKIKMEKKS